MSVFVRVFVRFVRSSQVKFNVNRSDNMIIQSISLLDQLDKDLNTFAMRIKEWYSWHFPVGDPHALAAASYCEPCNPPLTASRMRSVDVTVACLLTCRLCRSWRRS